MAPKKADTKKPEDDSPKVYVQVNVSWGAALLVSCTREASFDQALTSQSRLHFDPGLWRRGVRFILHFSWRTICCAARFSRCQQLRGVQPDLRPQARYALNSLLAGAFHACSEHHTCGCAGLPLLHQLLNNPLVLKVTATGSDAAAVASASLDFAPLAQALSEVPETPLQLTSADGQITLAAAAALKVQVSHLNWSATYFCSTLAICSHTAVLVSGPALV